MTLPAHINTRESQAFVDKGEGKTAKRVDICDGNGNSIINDDSQLQVVLDSMICNLNSTYTPLLADDEWVGTAKETLRFVEISVAIYSNVGSAIDGFHLDVSMDGVIWYEGDVFTIPAATLKTFTFQASTRYFRCHYINGGSDQTVFQLQTIVRKTRGKPSSHRVQDSIATDDDAELVKSVITGESPTGTFVNFGATRKGNFKVAIQEYGDTAAIDAFARLRISEPYTIFDSKQLHDKQPLFWDEEINASGTSNHSSVDACTVMTVTASASDSVIRQTKQRFNYQPGKSQFVLMTFHSTQDPSITCRIGLFDGTSANHLTPNNGIFFLCNNEVSWNIAKNGTITETALQADWNIDPMDGSGPSGYILDLDATQILLLDFEWLGVGRVRCGFVFNGIPYYVHQFVHANDPTFTTVYMSTPNLPLRYDIQSDGTSAGALDHICSTVMSEGGLEKTGILRSVDTTTPLNNLLSGTTYAVVGIRLKAAYNDITIFPETVSILCTTNSNFRWSLCINPTVAGTFTYTDITNSSAQVAYGAITNTISSRGLIISSGYVSSSTKTTSESLKTSLTLGSTIAGVQDTLVLTVTPITNNIDLYASLDFRELL